MGFNSTFKGLSSSEPTSVVAQFSAGNNSSFPMHVLFLTSDVSH